MYTYSRPGKHSPQSCPSFVHVGTHGFVQVGAHVGAYFVHVGAYFVQVGAYFVHVGAYLSLLVPILSLLVPILSILVPIFPSWCLFVPLGAHKVGLHYILLLCICSTDSTGISN